MKRAAADDEMNSRKIANRDDNRVVLINKLMVSLGKSVTSDDKLSIVHSQVDKMKSAMTSDLKDYSDNIIEAVVECGCTLTWKACVYSLLLSKLPVKLQNQVITKVIHKLSVSSSMENSVMVLRFICELCNVGIVGNASLNSFFESLCAKNLDCALLCMPWLHDKSPLLVKAISITPENSWQSLAADLKIAELSKPLMPQIYQDVEKRIDPLEIEIGDNILNQLGSLKPKQNIRDLNLFLSAGNIAVSQKDVLKISSMVQAEEKSGLEMAFESITLVSRYHKFILDQYVSDILIGYFPTDPVEAAGSLAEIGFDYMIYGILLNCLCACKDSDRMVFIQRILSELSSGFSARFGPISEDCLDAIIVQIPLCTPRERCILSNYVALQLSLGGLQCGWAKWDQLFAVDNERQDFIVDVIEQLVELNSLSAVEAVVSDTIKSRIADTGMNTVKTNSLSVALTTNTEPNLLRKLFEDAELNSDEEKLKYLVTGICHAEISSVIQSLSKVHFLLSEVVGNQFESNLLQLVTEHFRGSYWRTVIVHLFSLQVVSFEPLWEYLSSHHGVSPYSITRLAMDLVNGFDLEAVISKQKQTFLV